MNKPDCIKLMAMIKANYPAYHARTDEETRAAAVNIMATVLQDLSYKDCEMALLHYMTEPHEFPPNAGQIRNIVSLLHSPYNTLEMSPMIKTYWQSLLTAANQIADKSEIVREEDIF